MLLLTKQLFVINVLIYLPENPGCSILSTWEGVVSLTTLQRLNFLNY